jgi:hypothetical protein
MSTPEEPIPVDEAVAEEPESCSKLEVVKSKLGEAKTYVETLAADAKSAAVAKYEAVKESPPSSTSMYAGAAVVGAATAVAGFLKFKSRAAK